MSVQEDKHIGIIFDLDGTLWDSSKQVVDSWNLALEQCPDINRKITVKDMHDNMGKILPDIGKALITGVSDERRAEILELCCMVENEYIEKVGGELFDGAEEMFITLSRKYSLFIVSNCQAGYIEAFLKYYKFSKYFRDIECPGNTGKLKGDNIKLIMKRNNISKAVYVGDTFGDYEAATDVAGIPFVHARYGYGTVEEAQYAADSIQEVIKVIDQMTEEEIV